MAIALPIIFSSNGIASEHIFGHDSFVWNRDTSGQPGDSVRIVYDSLGMPIDTIRNDSASSAKPLFEDLITYNAKDSIRFSINGKKMFLYGEAYVKYITTELKANYIELDMELSPTARMIILGDWISKYTYVTFDGEHVFMENYIEGESEP